MEMDTLYNDIEPLKNHGSLDLESNGSKSYNHVMSEKRLKMSAGSVYIPSEKYSLPEGQDAHFICDEKQTIGVADGVGGCFKKGVDSGEYARELINNCFIGLYDHQSSIGALDPFSILSQACKETNITYPQGSSTACIITLQNNIIHAVNVGDSGFMVIRSGKFVYRSPVQQHRFNHPYQLGKDKDEPSIAQNLKVEVELGDVIVAGTDGLFDNLHLSKIEEIVKEGLEKGITPEELACSIAGFAYEQSFNRFADTPFARASKLANRSHEGGKVDDITVIAAFISYG